MIPQDWSVYMVECADGTLYSGIARDLQKRIEKHNSGKGAKYTASRLPVRLVYCEQAADRSLAQQREHQLKALTRQEKQELLRTYRPGIAFLKSSRRASNSSGV